MKLPSYSGREKAVKTIIYLCAACVCSAFASLMAGPSGYVTTFDNYNRNFTLSGQDAATGVYWDTNNYSPGLGQSDYVGIVSGYSTTNTDYWALLGGATGVAPVVPTSYLFRPLDDAGAISADFSTRFGIISSQIPRLAKDVFGWTFRDAAGLPLLEVRFVPHLIQLNQLTVRIYDSAGNELAGSGSQNIFYNSKYDLHISISAANRLTVTIGNAFGDAPNRIVNDQPLNVPNGNPLASLLHDVSATWEVSDLTFSTGIYSNFGSNSLVFNNFDVSLSGAPLPTSYSNWASQVFANSPGVNSNATADPDGDGVTNLLEYTFRQNPLVSQGSALKSVLGPNGERRIEFTWNPHATDLAYQLVGGNDLASSATWPLINFDVVGQQMEGDAWRVTIRPSGATGSRYFFRLRVNQTTP
jgi:hypothetical protein